MAINKGLFWLSSYPKSGNTWFRIFLANLLYAGDKSVDINQVESLIHDQITTNRYWFDRESGFDTALLSHDELDRLRPMLYREYSERHEVSYHKIHDAYTYLNHDEPLIPKEGCLGAIYFIRNPLDVVVSLANHFLCSIDDAIAILGNPTFAFYPLRQWFLSWSQHVMSWVNAKDINLLVLRYEDMLLDPLNSFTKAAHFLKLDVTPECILQAISNSEFNKLQKIETEIGFFEKPPRLKNFFRKGIVGDWKNTLNEIQIQKIIHDHAEVMEKFGYLNKDRSPIG